MLGLKLKAGLLSLVVVSLAISYAATAAYAEGGPYFHHRNVEEKGNGEKISEKAPDSIVGKGGEQRLTGTIGGQSAEVVSGEVQVKGIVYNNENQGQQKLVLELSEPKLAKPEIKGCKVKYGKSNVVKFTESQSYKWNQTKKQLEQKKQLQEQTPERFFTPLPLKVSKEEEESNEIKMPSEEITTLQVEKNGGECILAGSYKLNGSLGVLSSSPPGFEEWSQAEKLVAPGYPMVQQRWNNKTVRYQGLFTSLVLGGSAAELKGGYEIKDPTHELAIYEE